MCIYIYIYIYIHIYKARAPRQTLRATARRSAPARTPSGNNTNN